MEVNRDTHAGSFAKYSEYACCVSHRATGLPVMVHDMHTRRTRPDYLQACPTGPPVDGVKSALTPALWTCAALWPCTVCSDPASPSTYKYKYNYPVALWDTQHAWKEIVTRPMSEYFANDPECHDLLPSALRSHRVAGLGCPTGPLVGGVTSTSTPALCRPVALYLLQ